MWSKFWVGVTPLIVLALALTIGTNLILRVTGFMMALSVATILIVTVALSALALGFGAVFPKFDTENPAEIPTSFGGLLFMMAATAYLAVMIMLQAWPVYAILRARQDGYVPPGLYTAFAVAGAAALLLSLVVIVVPLRIAVERIEALDR
jgi:ABC-2 type transport system permease protein